MKIGMPELILIQFIIYMGIYLMDSYTGILICLVMAPIFFCILAISVAAELIEPSRISKSYFKFMITGVIVPVMVLIIAFTMDPGAIAVFTE